MGRKYQSQPNRATKKSTTVPPHRRPYYDADLDCYRVPLTQGKTALIDTADVPLVAGRLWCWGPCSTNDGSAICREHGALVRLDRLLTGAAAGERVTHWNDNTLDYRRRNLARGSHADTSRRMRKHRGTSSVYKGVTWLKREQRWRANIYADGRTRYLGCYSSERAAAVAYDDAALLYFGRFARLNFPDQQHGQYDKEGRR